MERLVYNKGEGQYKNWIITESTFDNRYLGKCEAIFTQGNGYIGLRNALEEKYVGEKRNMFITGTFNKASEEDVTELPNIPDVTNIELILDGQMVNLNCKGVNEYKRELNLRTGEVQRSFTWCGDNGLKAQIKFRRFVSLVDENLIGSALDIEVNKDAELVIISGIDGAVTNSGAQHFNEIERRIYDEKYMQFITNTSESKVQVAIHSTYLCNYDEVSVLPIMGRRTLFNKYTVKVTENKKFSFEKLSDVRSDRDKEFIGFNKSQALDLLKENGLNSIKVANQKGYEALFKKSVDKWERFWEENDILIESKNEFEQVAIRFALYHLNIMVKHDDNRVGIGAKALTGEGYKGHSFWDTEIFILPYFTFTNPKTARTLLEYRYKCLYGARKKAIEYGYKGAMYPWECAWIDDGEVTPLSGGADVVTGQILPILTGMLEHHITADIAYAVWQYYKVTNDLEFMELYGYEIILDTAKFWCSRLEFNEEKDRFEINNVIGPDEYKEHVDNNAYTNYMAVNNMKLALNIINNLSNSNQLKYEQLNNQIDLEKLENEINSCIDKVYLPIPNQNGIIPQNDSYLSLKYLDLTEYKNTEEVMTIYNDFNMELLNQYMVSKQSDLVMLLFVLESLFEKGVKVDNFKFYEDKTLHDSSLSKSTHMVLANDYELYELADKLFEGAISIDLGKNMNSSNEGIHSASMGGIWQSVVMGYGGLRLEENILRISPHIPERWTSLSYSTVWHGNKLEINVTGEKVKIKNKGNEPIKVKIYGEEITINVKSTVVRGE